MTSEVYESCEWIEGGLGFNRRSLHTCLIAHHNSGLPLIAEYYGGAIPLAAVLARRAVIRTHNRSGGLYPECRGCAHLKTRAWPPGEYPIEIVGIAHYSYCNVKCSYCFLQTQDPASFSAGYKPYSLLSVVEQLIGDGQLAPWATIDWGGGEPSIYPEFEWLLERLLAHGSFHYIHTNGTRFPTSLRRGMQPERVHVICSVDAGLRETYRRIKQKDYLNRVWNVLSEYVAVGATVTLKYVITDENWGDSDLELFVSRAAELQPHGVVVDLDLNIPVPKPWLVVAMGRLKALAGAAGLPARFGFTGLNFTPEGGASSQAEAAFIQEQRRLGKSNDALDGDLPLEWPVGGIYEAFLRLRNSGPYALPASTPEGKSVTLVVFVDGLIQAVVPLPHDLQPGGSAMARFTLKFPLTSSPAWEVRFALAEQGVRWLDASGIAPSVIRVRVLPPWRTVHRDPTEASRLGGV